MLTVSRVYILKTDVIQKPFAPSFRIGRTSELLYMWPIPTPETAEFLGVINSLCSLLAARVKSRLELGSVLFCSKVGVSLATVVFAPRVELPFFTQTI